VKLKAFSKFENTTEALAAATAIVDSKLSKGPPRLRLMDASHSVDLTVLLRNRHEEVPQEARTR
jgi:hypothetical protein